MSDTTAPTTSLAQQEFEEWFLKNYPRDCILGIPEWHAPKIYRAATRQLERELTALKAQLARNDIVICELNRQLTVLDGALIECEKDALRNRWMIEHWAFANGTIFFDGFNAGPFADLNELIDDAIDRTLNPEAPK